MIAHGVTLKQDDKYAHLHWAQCGCGWLTGSAHVSIVRRWAANHLWESLP